MSRIERVRARQILDSRGYPTLEVDVILATGAYGRAAVPAGSSTGRYEAQSLRDGGEAWDGRGVLAAVAVVEREIAPRIVGLDVRRQEELDALLVDLDGTSSLVRLGANTLLGVSLATARAAAAHSGQPLWRHLRAGGPPRLPTPMLCMLEGGLHADNRLAIQEVLLVPLGAPTYAEALRMGAAVYHQLGYGLLARGMSRAVGDEGGFAPAVADTRAALDLVLAAVVGCGLRPGVDIGFALDAAASELWNGNGYLMDGESPPLASDRLIAYWEELFDQYPIVSLEDPLGEEDWVGWRRLTTVAGDRVQLVGDDLFATHPSLVQLGIDQRVANAVLIKPDQVGTLTRTLETIGLAHDAGYVTVMAGRSGDTEDTTIADIAVAKGCRFIKAGAPARSERVAKYNRLLRVSEEMEDGYRASGGRGV
jgi:enolase